MAFNTQGVGGGPYCRIGSPRGGGHTGGLASYANNCWNLNLYSKWLQSFYKGVEGRVCRKKLHAKNLVSMSLCPFKQIATSSSEPCTGATNYFDQCRHMLKYETCTCLCNPHHDKRRSKFKRKVLNRFDFHL